MDLYYPETKVYRNKLNIENADKLAAAEKDILAVRLLEVISNKSKQSFDYEHLKRIHRQLYGDIYTWAGKQRTFMPKKVESSIIGTTPSFSYSEIIKPVIEAVFKKKDLAEVNLNKMDLKGKVDFFSKLLSEIWKVHPFVKGNTVTATIFLERYAKSQGITFDYQILINHMSYLRKALIHYTDGGYGESDYLNVIIKDAIRNEKEKEKYINPESIEFEIKKAGFKPTPKLVDMIETINIRFSKLHTVPELIEVYKNKDKLPSDDSRLINDIAEIFQGQEIRQKQVRIEKQNSLNFTAEL